MVTCSLTSILREYNNSGGWAEQGNLNLQLSDLGTVSTYRTRYMSTATCATIWSLSPTTSRTSDSVANCTYWQIHHCM